MFVLLDISKYLTHTHLNEDFYLESVSTLFLTKAMCHTQVFAYTKRQQIMSDDMCLDAASPQGPVKIVRCHGMGGNQAWVYNDEVRDKGTRNCINKTTI